MGPAPESGKPGLDAPPALRPRAGRPTGGRLVAVRPVAAMPASRVAAAQETMAGVAMTGATRAGGARAGVAMTGVAMAGAAMTDAAMTGAAMAGAAMAGATRAAAPMAGGSASEGHGSDGRASQRQSSGPEAQGPNSEWPRALVLTCGEPAGIGPEIAARAWEALGARLPFAWIGDPAHLPSGVPVREVTEPGEAAHAAASALPVLPHAFPTPATPGRPAAQNAAEVVAVIARAVQLVQSGAAAGLVTGPIHKKALQDGAGFAYPGHTEYLAALAGADRVVMMLACPDLRVVPATIHVPLAEVPAALTAEGLTATIRITHAALRRDFGIAVPRIAVAGLNPHAGEGGAIGGEEIELIGPVLAGLRAEGYALDGPLSADTMFHPAARARYDAAVAMYHDQALIPIKTIDFAGGVNVTLGLPFIRTSPDHGTAFDIAGQGRADATSLIAALRMADAMARARALA